MYKQNLQLKRQQLNILKEIRTIFSDELHQINPLDKCVSRDSFNGVVIKPTQETLDAMMGKYK